MKRLLAILFAFGLIIPQITHAAWWNPFTWKVFVKESKTEQPLATTTVSVEVTATTTVVNTSKAGSAVKSVASANLVPSKYPLFVSSIHAFLAQPNLIALTEVCKQAKNVPTGNMKETLSSDRLTIQKAPLTFYDDFINMCGLLDRKDVKAVNATPQAFIFNLSADDTDSVRTAKIQSNSNMANKNKYAQFYLYTTTENLSKLIDSEDLSMRCPTKDEISPKKTDSMISVPSSSFGTTSFSIHAPTLFILSMLNDMTRPKIIGIELNAIEKALQDNIVGMDLGYGANFSLNNICF